MLPVNVNITFKDLMSYTDESRDEDAIKEGICDYLTERYDYCVNAINYWEYTDDGVTVYGIDWDDDYEDYMDEIEELDLDDDAYEYYYNHIIDLHNGDDTESYKSYEDIVADARRTAEMNNSYDNDDD